MVFLYKMLNLIAWGLWQITTVWRMVSTGTFLFDRVSACQVSAHACHEEYSGNTMADSS